MNESSVDNEFIRDVVDRYSDMIFRVSYQYVRNKQDAEDVLQEVFCEMLNYQRQNKFQSDEHMKAWLIRVTINKSINLCKRNARRKKNENLAGQDVRIEPKFDELDYLLANLSADDREAIYLRYYEGYSSREIAELMNTTEKAIFKRLSRARQKLKNFLEEV